MYKEHYGLQELPFGITPDTQFFFAHNSYQEALNTLLIAARSGEGFLKVVGEVGTGKTLLCRKFLNQLDTENFITAFIPNPYLEPMTLLLAIADELGVRYPENANQHQLLNVLIQFLVDTRADDKKVLLCLDEAQAMPIESLEALRLLTNLETESEKLLQVVLFGQPELDVRLNDPAIRQLKQRITFSCNLNTLNLQDTEYYLAHRLSIAGYRGARLFSRGAVRALHSAGRGVPRLINILAHKALLAGFGEGVRYITDQYVKQAILDTESTRSRYLTVRRRWLSLGVLLAAVAASTGALVWAHWL